MRNRHVLVAILLWAVTVTAGLAPVRAEDVTWTERAVLVPMFGEPGSWFGIAAAIDSDTVVIGAAAANSAYVFVRAGGLWLEEARLTGVGQFGLSVAIDGDTVVVGARLADDNGQDSGAAHVFVRGGGEWTEQTELLAGDGAMGDRFGGSVGISGDTIVVGASYAEPNGFRSGAAYVFTRTGTVWSQQAKLVSSANALGDQFGNAVAISGETALVGADLEDPGGAAYVFVRSAGVWSEQARLVSAVEAALFGFAVDLDRDTAIVGAYLDDPSGANTGAAYVYSRDGSSWTQQAQLAGSQIHGLGNSVSVDGDVAIVGEDPGSPPALGLGSAWVFTRSAGSWTLQDRVFATEAQPRDRFGCAVALDATTVVIGAYEREDENGVDSGAAYVFRPSSVGGVPAIGGVGRTFLLIAMLGTGAYFLRRP